MLVWDERREDDLIAAAVAAARDINVFVSY